ncbi:MAG: RNHCP domain-containing protein [Patescibacteria group bacterium]
MKSEITSHSRNSGSIKNRGAEVNGGTLNDARMSQLFQRTIEDFTCGRCGRRVIGNGYTNHCPTCLWSRHVDINPGDRTADCRGLMEPVGLEIRGDAYVIMHRCVQCGLERKNSASPQDNNEAVIRLAVIGGQF